MRTVPLRLPVLVAAALLGLGSAAAGAPLHPDRLREDPGALSRLAPEPTRPDIAGVTGVATAAGRVWTGHPRILVLLVDFEDQPATAGFDLDYFREFLFSVNETEFGSLRDYFRTATYGRMDVTGEVHGWYRMPLRSDEYAGGNSGFCVSCFPRNARGLAAHAVEAAVKAGVDVRDYDNDGPDGIPGSGDDDGILDGLFVVHSGYGTERTLDENDIRSHYWNMTAMTEVDGIRIPDYAVIPELENLGVAVHEFGHLLGAEDLYDLTGSAGGIGWFSIMGWAIWYNNARQPGAPDAFTRMEWGVLSPETPGADEPDLDIPAINTTPYALRLWTRGEEGNEYFLVENRMRDEGLDTFLPGEGLVVYHVDEGVPKQNNASRYRVSVVQADGLNSINGGLPRNLGEPGDFYPGSLNVRRLDDTTVPNTRNHRGEATGVALRVRSDAGPVIRVGVEVGRSVGGAPVPGLSLSPAGGWFGDLPSPGRTEAVTARVLNDGSRLRGGTLTLFSRDPRVGLDVDAPLGVPDIAALGRWDLDRTLLVTLPDGSSGSGLLPVEAVWSTGEREYAMTATIPTEDTVVRRTHFEEEEPDAIPAGINGRAPLWVRRSDYVSRGSWAWAVGGRGGFPANQDAALEMGPYTIGPYAEIRFRHRLNIVGGDGHAFDGGFLEVARGDGPFRVVEPTGGYPASFVVTQGNPYPGGPAFAGLRDAWEWVTVPLEDMEGTIRFRFHFVSDFSAGIVTGEGWFIDEFVVLSWPETRAAVFDRPVADGADTRIGFSILPVFPTEAPYTVRLIRSSPVDRFTVGAWTGAGRMDRDLRIRGLTPGQHYAFVLEHSRRGPDGDELWRREEPVRFIAPGGAGPMLASVPSIVTRSRGARIRYRVPGGSPAPVTLNVYDVRGRRVSVLRDGVHEPGIRDLVWSGRGDTGAVLPAGVYFLRMTAPERSETARIVLLP